MNDLSIFIVGVAEEGIQTVGEIDALTFKPTAPQNDASVYSSAMNTLPN